MTYLIILLLLALWGWIFHRGRLAVRAYVYLGVLSRTGSQDTANVEALSFGFMAAMDYAADATAFANSCFNGSQLGIITAARKAGFRG